MPFSVYAISQFPRLYIRPIQLTGCIVVEIVSSIGTYRYGNSNSTVIGTYDR